MRSLAGASYVGDRAAPAAAQQICVGQERWAWGRGEKAYHRAYHGESKAVCMLLLNPPPDNAP